MSAISALRKCLTFSGVMTMNIIVFTQLVVLTHDTLDRLFPSKWEEQNMLNIQERNIDKSSIKAQD